MSETRGGVKARMAELFAQKRELANDEGFISVGMPVALGRLLLRRHALILGTALAAPLVLGHYADALSGENAADLEEARTTGNVKLIEFNPNRKIDVADAYFDVELDARDIPVGLNLAPDCKMNMNLRGTGRTNYKVPFTAIRQTPDGDKIDFEIDMSQVTARADWPGAGPEVRQYTVDGGKKNFGDREGFRCALNGLTGAAGRFLGADSQANKLEDIKSGAAHDMKLKGLELFGERCSDMLQKPVREAAKLALKDNILLLGRGDVIDDITTTTDPFKLEKKINHVYKIKDFKVDKVNCQQDPEAVPEELKGGTS